eukprot:CAMPEP_0171348240 /NCGR_PEP_ID=MMETSP0878-20121228/30317_1 /TAXON_ID=67004 /ORGANISM="Thalassiosira weissflogii, Strain CCMP1336" /LENGTH=233 /DNA_ID=CAMNT_0011852525 /DNA_START=276 /DNA_END=977 /DNA_ORIENTATION=+
MPNIEKNQDLPSSPQAIPEAEASHSVKPNTKTKQNESNDDNEIESTQPIQYFLLKSEPDEYSISDLQNDKTEEWDGIRNYQARNHLRSMRVNDRAYFYHSKTTKKPGPGIVGTVRIARTARPDASAFDKLSEYYDAKCTGPEDCRWVSVLVEFEQKFPVVLNLKELKEIKENDPKGVIAGIGLFKQSRLSVVPLTEEEWDELMRLIRRKMELEVDFGESEDEAKKTAKKARKI